MRNGATRLFVVLVGVPERKKQTCTANERGHGHVFIQFTRKNDVAMVGCRSASYLR